MSRARVVSNARSVKRKVQEATKRGLTDAGMLWHGDAIRITPVDTGQLRASLAWVASGSRQHSGSAAGQDGEVATSSYRVEAPKGSVRLGTNVEYAPFVHENLDAHHPVGQAKFIETPLRQRGEVYVREVVQALREALK